ncbi:MAG: ATP synthase F1 subunit delta [Coriobacteriia bacterium]|nr:ATP synthase F1 subunit delta [Coriobacteriia bacterium]
MRTNDAATGYARALFGLATLSDSVDATDESFRAVVAAVRGSMDLREALTSTGLPVEKQREIVREIFGASVTPEALSMTTLLVERGHVALLGDVATAYRAIAEAERGIVVAEVTTAVPLDDALRASVSDKLTASLGRPVSLRETVDASIVGGIIIKVAGRVLDGSVSSQLEGMRQALATTPQGGEA